MKASFVIAGYARKPNGGNRVIYSFANHLVERGHDVTIVHVALSRRALHVHDGRPKSQLKELLAGARDLVMPAPNGLSWHRVDPRVQMRYAPVISDRYVPDGDAVIATAWQTADPVAGLSRSKGRGCYLIQHHETWSGAVARVDSTWRLPLHRVFIARWLEARARTMGLEGVVCVPGIDVGKFRVEQPIEERPRRATMLNSGFSWKGCDDGIAALALAKRSVPGLEAVLFGTPDRPADLPTWIEYRQNPPQADLVSDIYNGSSVYLCPSHAEGWHLPPAEAMASGCALVTTDIDGVRDYAVPRVSALLSPIRDPEALAANLVLVMQDDSLRRKLAMQAHALIQQYSAQRSAEAFEATLFDAAPAV